MGKAFDDKWKEVSKEEFDKFRTDYPVRLEFDVCHMVDPPVATWNDFSGDTKWPESVAAQCVEDYDPTTGKPEPRKYYLLRISKNELQKV